MNNILKVCIFTNHFYPENFKVNDVAFELVKLGYSVTVITAIPDYPRKSLFRKKYSLLKKRKESVNGVDIIRLPIIPRYKGSSFFLILNYFSYFLTSYIYTFFHSFFVKYDAVFVHETSPFFIGVSAVLLKRRQRIPLLFWTLDLWPESITAVSHIKNSFILFPFFKMVKYVYYYCDKILIGSKGFLDSICQKGDFFDKCVYFPNWAECVDSSCVDFNIRNIKPFKDLKEDDFVFLFAGNIGEAQNLDFIVDAIKRLEYLNNVKFVFVGDGRKKEELEDYVDKNYLNTKIFFTGSFPLSYMPSVMAMANVLFVSLRDEEIFNVTVPSKVQFYMAQGLPILAVLNGDGYDLVNEARCGIAVHANDMDELLLAFNTFITMDKQRLKILGYNGKEYYKKNFEKSMRIKQLDNLLLEL